MRCPQTSGTPAAYPTPLCAAFLQALEESGSVATATGWYPQHIVINGDDGQTAACLPMYLKAILTENIFLTGLGGCVRARRRLYYPKLQPLCPYGNGAPNVIRKTLDDHYGALISAMVNPREHKVSLMTFPRDQWEMMGKSGFLLRTSKQFHWENKVTRRLMIFWLS